MLALSILSLWIYRHPLVWGGLLALSLGLGWQAGMILPVGLVFVLLWVGLWLGYLQAKKPLIFVAILLMSFGMKLHLLPGFIPMEVAPKLRVGFDSPLVGLLPLALFVPIWKGWPIDKGFWLGVFGIVLIAIIGALSGAFRLGFRLPDPLFLLFNFIFTAIPEEGFYRGFLQRELSRLGGPFVGIVLASSAFTLAHVLWAHNLAALGFVFLASLLYGLVYWLSGKIESAILCHFLLNAVRYSFSM